ncbi:MAG: TonB-dependent receptor [bacterium]
MKLISTLFALTITSMLLSQNTVSGIVYDTKGKPIEGANVYIEGTYDGNTSNEIGAFSFTTEATNIQTLIVSYITFETYTKTGSISDFKDLKITLREDVNALDAVVISAGSFAAGDNSKINVLKPLDVVTTASALGDFVGALQTLPGTTTAAEDGRLFVRGGQAEETQIFIDGIRVFTPYTPTTNNIPTRGRYSPFLFDGITFSTGGYSAEYGQALSSVLLLNTVNEPDQEKTDIGLMSVGGTLGNTQKWEKSSLSVNTSYINLAPYIAVFPDRNDWEDPFQSASGEAVYRRKFKNGLLKFYSAFDITDLKLTQEDINLEDGLRFGLNNKNLYVNTSYQGMLNDNWTITTGASYTHARNKVLIAENNIANTENSLHFKLKFKKRFSNRFRLYFGSEYFRTDFDENFNNEFVSQETYGFVNSLVAGYTEADIFFSKKLAFKPGIRFSKNNLLNTFQVDPRLSLAYKFGEKSQLSLAYGSFHQRPLADVLKFEQNLENEQVDHFILNYQYNNKGQIFRAEAYHKAYDNLITYNSEFTGPTTDFTNNGSGYATGIDFFWRDNKSVKNLDYWVSYSLLDTKRLYQNFPIEAVPNFANTHNLSVVGKYWVDSWKSQLGISYAFASGRTFTNPNTTGFLNEKTKAFNSLSFNWAYLIDQQKILYFSVNNLLGFNNINGYQYANTPDNNGVFNRRALRPAADQFFFVGFFWTISEDKTSNQLDNL